MEKQELIELVRKTCGLSKKQAEQAVNTVFCKIKDALLEGREVRIPYFGVFSVKEVKEKKGYSIATGGEITFPARKKVTFRVLPQMKRLLLEKGLKDAKA